MMIQFAQAMYLNLEVSITSIFVRIVTRVPRRNEANGTLEDFDHILLKGNKLRE